MQQAISSQNIQAFGMENYSQPASAKISLVKRFTTWLNKQEEERFMWLGIALMGGIATVLPLTLLAVVFFAANNFTLWIITLSVNVPVLITNLSAQPAKITVPALLFSWLVNAVIIGYCAITFFFA